MVDYGHWKYEGVIPDDCFGFIYEIECVSSKKKYIGKKQIQRKLKRSPLKGNKNKRISIVESDWKIYTGSCTQLNEDISKLGKSDFLFTILKLCSCKWELSYEEAKLQFEREVLLKDDYYNGILNCRIGKRPKKLS